MQLQPQAFSRLPDMCHTPLSPAHPSISYNCCSPSLSRLHVKQAGCSADAALWEGLHCVERTGRPAWRSRAVQIPLRETENVRRRRNTQPLPWLWRSRGRNGEWSPWGTDILPYLYRLSNDHHEVVLGIRKLSSGESHIWQQHQSTDLWPKLLICVHLLGCDCLVTHHSDVMSSQCLESCRYLSSFMS